MEIENVCRCCLTLGTHQDMNTPYFWQNQNEVYYEMLTECFNINLSSRGTALRICDNCIIILRDSLEFKHQVLRSEQEFLRRLNESQNVSKTVQIKIELKEENTDDSDDHFSTEAARDEAIKDVIQVKEPVKKKAEQKRSKSGIVKLAKIKLDAPPGPKPRSRVSWRSRADAAKAKHRHNLRAVLRYSNATPFKNKGLLGYTCAYCPWTHGDPRELRAHTASHDAARLELKCKFDIAEFNVKFDVRDLTCTLCDAKLDNLNAFKDHITKIHAKTYHTDINDHLLQFKLKKGDVYDCAMCPSTYETFKMLKQHMNKHYSNYTCTKCEASFATKRSLNSHATTHREGSFKCEYCEKIFSTKPKRNYHQKMKHLGARNISNCPYCDEPFRSYYQRNRHLVKVHNSEVQYKCTVCSKAYVLKTLLMAHIKKSHLMERNYQCNECGYRFFNKKALTAHMVKHSGVRSHVCGVCLKAYARKSTLREHTRIHEQDKRFRCDVCQHAFVQKCSLRSHLLTNHGLSVQACDISESGPQVLSGKDENRLGIKI